MFYRLHQLENLIIKLVNIKIPIFKLQEYNKENIMTAIPKPPKKQYKKKHLDRDEFELEELAMALSEAHQSKEEKIFTVYNREGLIQGKVSGMNPTNKLITIVNGLSKVNVHFLDILKVETPS